MKTYAKLTRSKYPLILTSNVEGCVIAQEANMIFCFAKVFSCIFSSCTDDVAAILSRNHFRTTKCPTDCRTGVPVRDTMQRHVAWEIYLCWPWCDVHWWWLVWNMICNLVTNRAKIISRVAGINALCYDIKIYSLLFYLSLTPNSILPIFSGIVLSPHFVIIMTAWSHGKQVSLLLFLKAKLRKKLTYKRNKMISCIPAVLD